MTEPKPNEPAGDSARFPESVQEQLEKLVQASSDVKNFRTQVFTARQGYFEKLILLDGATLTLLFTVLAGLSHAETERAALAHVGSHLFVGSWLLVLSIILSLVHNQLNISFIVNMNAAFMRSSVHHRRGMLRFSLMEADIDSELSEIPPTDPKVNKNVRRGFRMQWWCRWVGFAAQASTIIAYVEFVLSLQRVIYAFSVAAH